eukprot:Plantae.Rhodophyta-Rhodochaete_pulchella.ctg23722.p1 GENE.Plantae.Rhodophyta-Rhodochaete_pulchella.ctg23722~~Plantae.Rhodophyta-Rhodochaete_pulchella.ctg23722.p1  ORF type:complete len:585 (+),score=137.30 Plantae.Rhodophyta-Rhodochaete_pulchella.ctg23722:77-1831(+)
MERELTQMLDKAKSKERKSEEIMQLSKRMAADIDAKERELVMARQELEEKNDMLATLQRQAEEHKQEVATVSALNSGMSQENATLKQALQQAEYDGSEKANRISSLSALLESNDTEIENLKEQLTSQGASNKVALRDLTNCLEEKENELREKNILIESLKSDLEETAKESHQKLAQRDQDTASLEERLGSLDRAYQVASNELDTLRSDSERKDDTLRSFEEQIASLQTSLSQSTRARDQAQERVKENADQIGNLLTEKEANGREIHALNETISGLRQTLEQSVNELASIRATLASKDAEVQALRDTATETTASFDLRLRQETATFTETLSRLDRERAEARAQLSSLESSLETEKLAREKVEEENHFLKQRCHSQESALVETSLQKEKHAEAEFDRLSSELQKREYTALAATAFAEEKNKEMVAMRAKIECERAQMISNHDSEVWNAVHGYYEQLREALAVKTAKISEMQACLKTLESEIISLRSSRQESLNSAVGSHLVKPDGGDSSAEASGDMNDDCEIERVLDSLYERNEALRWSHATLGAELELRRVALEEKDSQIEELQTELSRVAHTVSKYVLFHGTLV